MQYNSMGTTAAGRSIRQEDLLGCFVHNEDQDKNEQRHSWCLCQSPAERFKFHTNIHSKMYGESSRKVPSCLFPGWSTRCILLFCLHCLAFHFNKREMCHWFHDFPKPLVNGKVYPNESSTAMKISDPKIRRKY